MKFYLIIDNEMKLVKKTVQNGRKLLMLWGWFILSDTGST